MRHSTLRRYGITVQARSPRPLPKAVDLHRQVAASLFSVRPEDVTVEQRQAAKSATFGARHIGGLSAATQYGIMVHDAIEQYVTGQRRALYYDPHSVHMHVGAADNEMIYSFARSLDFDEESNKETR